MSPELSIAKLNKLYLEKYEHNFWAVYNIENREQVKPFLKYNFLVSISIRISTFHSLIPVLILVKLVIN